MPRSAIEYLDKDKDLLTKKQIEYNKLKATFSRQPTDELRKQIVILRGEIAQQKKKWEDKPDNDMRLSGFLRTAMYKQGFGKLDKKGRIQKVLDFWNDRLKNITDKKEKHVGLRRFVLAPSLDDIQHASSIDFKDYGKQERDLIAKYGEQTVKDNKERMAQFMDDIVRDTFKKFRTQYLPKGDNIGYAFSTHFDTKIPHAHVYLFPYSEKGQYLSMNAQKFLRGVEREKAIRNPNQKVENKLDFLVSTAVKTLDRVKKKYLGLAQKSEEKIPFNPKKIMKLKGLELK
tara:strand:+ start:672 stop:1532 length:861 start_codon:yes stop_codon:yes gene_type:complete